MNFPKTLTVLLFTGIASSAMAETVQVPAKTKDFVLRSADVRHLEDLDLLVFEQRVAGTAGHTTPQPRGQQDGAPVLAYVFPTTLGPADVGFTSDEGIVALAATSHPDFDDTPLWDENQDSDYGNDGKVYHSHWVLLVKDSRVPGGLSVKAVVGQDTREVLPPTAPGMPIFLDSPGFPVVLKGHRLQIPVPTGRVRNNTAFRFDAVTAYLEVNTSDPNRPTLGVYEAYSVLSGDLSLPFEPKRSK